MNKKQKIAGRLKVLFPKANLSTKRIDAIVAKLELKIADDADDTAIDDVVNQANEFMDFEAIAKEDDRIRTLEANQKKTTTDPTTDPKQPTNDEEIPTWAKAMMQTMESLKQGEVVKSRQSSIAAAFEKSEVLKNLKPNIKESWLKRIQISDELTDEQIAEQIIAFETEYQELTQTAADNQNYVGPVPTFTNSNDEMTIEDMKSIYEN